LKHCRTKSQLFAGKCSLVSHRFLLADDPGAGKTIMALSLMAGLER
jgi:hypothetical protein